MLPISFLSDYGHRDEWVGVCHGVIGRIAPGVNVIDVAHDLPPTDVRHAAFVLENALPFLPSGVVLAVVDPGVGTSRRGLAVRTRSGVLLIGPDNGLLWPATESAGGTRTAIDISSGPFRLDPVSATFHGRDLFAPVAAHLARGAALEDAGQPVDPAGLTRLEIAKAAAEQGSVRAEVRLVDRFGNVQLQARPVELQEAGLSPGDSVLVAGMQAVYGRTFADAAEGDLVVYEDSAGWIAVALNGESAADRLGAQSGSSLRISQ
jgi:S-adenosylmethionine hydrolase